jgi:polysaccharide export outer membrane protein
MNTKTKFKSHRTLAFCLFAFALAGCADRGVLPQAAVKPSITTSPENYRYLVGPYDTLSVFVWGNSEISGTFEVRPDGMISTSLVEDIQVSGKTPTQIARDIEKALATYIREPIVTVSVTEFNGPFSEQVRVIGEAAAPKALPFTENLTLLDVMIQVNGLTDFAAGNNAVLSRIESGQYKEYRLRIEDLVQDGDVSANVDVLPGDIITIPEAWF